MSARSKGDNLNLSLTGSQIGSTASSVRKSSSARQLHRAGSSNDVHRDGASGMAKRSSSHGLDGLSQRSNRSDISSVSKVSSKKAKVPGDDFLALFENSMQPKIKSAGVKSKKPGPNAVKVMWEQPAKKSNGGADRLLSPSPPGHNFFQPQSVRSSDEETEREYISRQIEELQRNASALSVRSTNSHDGLDFLKSQNHDALNDLNEGGSASNRNRPSSSRSSKSVKNNATNGKSTSKVSNSSKPVNGVANNMVLTGKSPRTKASFTSIENSYQNIKHKTPVNQVKENQSHSASSASVGRNIAEDYIQTLNSAAIKIQQCFRKYRAKQDPTESTEARHRAGEAAIRRMMEQKKKEYEDFNKLDLHLLDNVDREKKREEDRKKIREEKAKQERQKAIEELRKKREAKREDVKKKAEAEISYLQASGKITKTPMKASIGKKKTANKSSNKDGKVVSQDFSDKTSEVASSARTVSTLMADQDEELESASNVQLADSHSTTDPKTDRDGRQAVSEAPSKSTLNDLLETLKKLEEEEHLITPKPEKKNAWLDDLDKDLSADDNPAHLTAERLKGLNKGKDRIAPVNSSNYLTDDKLRSIMSFLDEVQVSDRLSAVEQDLTKASEDYEIPPPLVPSVDELAEMENAQAAANEVTSTVLSQRLELEEKKRTVIMLQKALNQQRELTVRHAREADKDMKKRLDVQKDEYEETIKRHLSFIDQLIDDKKSLSEKCETLVKELKTVDKKYQDKIKSMEDRHSIEMQKIKDMHEAAEKLRRERWIEEKTKKIKEMTVQGLEPEIQRLIAKHKNEIKKIKQIQEADILASDERAAQRYVRMTEELRDQLAKEKEAACARERELAKERYEKELRNEEEAYQQQRRRLHQEVQEEKERVAIQASRQRTELDKLQRQLEDSHSLALSAMKVEFEKAREEQDKRHAIEIREMRERLKVEKESWEENFMKKQETWMSQKERELKDQVRRDRDKEIELVITRLEEDATRTREENERTLENKLRRMREKYDNEMKDLEHSEQQALDKYNEMKARLTEVSGENECLKVQLKQKDQEIEDLQKLTDKMHRERDRVSDIIRQEFADRLVATEEENKRIKNDMSEMKARHRIELDRSKDDIEEVKRQKDQELEEVHQRVKQAIVKKEEVVNQLRQQCQAAQKRADHLEGLLQQQRKQLLGK
ncbi:hypothetical protein FSP39_012118 [Pinctada imbricata]|uniref:5-azacytidine-induced protein 1 n=1 Tax=Pinctada imbricata TaxID=66713 RepID=A0AA88XQM6_PINIB|nr:hypothetical protein FSP39_012118 [Pinctada imbricata]